MLFKDFSLLIIIIIIILIHVPDAAICYFNRRIISPGRSVTDNTATIVVTKAPFPGSIFPRGFKLTFKNAKKQHVDYEFEIDDGRITKPLDVDNMFRLKGIGGVERVEGSNVAMEVYKCLSNAASATLYNNSYFTNDLKVSTTIEFSAIVTIAEERYRYSVVPMINDQKIGRMETVRSTLSHVVRTDLLEQHHDTSHDYVLVPDSAKHKLYKKQRAVSGQPVSGYVECVVVADYSSYLKHKRESNIASETILLIYMKIFYTHLFNSVNRRYLNSFTSDADLRLEVKLTNFVIITTSQEDSAWTDTTVVGIPGNESLIYNDKEVILATRTLSKFRTMMELITFPFTYDHAVGMFDKDLWLDDATLPAATRSSVAGVAYVGAVCSSFRYSIVEDNGFNSILIVAHEIGHSLGSYHDGDATFAPSCLSTDNYIMTPAVGDHPNNLQNYFRFSTCSISLFKSRLLDSNGPFKTQYSCLKNIPIGSELELSYFNTSLPGQLFSADEQCQMLFGSTSDASSCTQTNMCTRLSCSKGLSCWITDGQGALDGTTCDTNKICLQGACLNNTLTLATNYSCAVNPCLNGGACVTPTMGAFYLCSCANGYTGQQCELTTTTTTKQNTGMSYKALKASITLLAFTISYSSTVLVMLYNL